MAVGTIKIDQLAFIKDLVIEKKLTDCNANVILIKTGLAIEIEDPKNYNETDLQEYQSLIGKLIYLAYGTRPDIAFIIEQLSKYNDNLPKSYL